MAEKSKDPKIRKNLLHIIFCIIIIAFSGIFVGEIALYLGARYPDITESGDFPSYNFNIGSGTPISPITIGNNSDVSSYSVRGDGLSWETAYIIENFSIGGDFDTLITLENISVFTKIQNFNLIGNGSSFYTGLISLRNCQNIKFVNVAFSKIENSRGKTAISADNCENVSLDSLDMPDLGYSLRFEDSTNISINKLNIHGNDVTRILLEDCQEVRITNSIFNLVNVYSIGGIYLSDCLNVEIYNNSFRGYSGFDSISSDNIRFDSNVVENTASYGRCISIQWGNNITITNNKIILNSSNNLLDFSHTDSISISNNVLLNREHILYFNYCSTVEVIANDIISEFSLIDEKPASSPVQNISVSDNQFYGTFNGFSYINRQFLSWGIFFSNSFTPISGFILNLSGLLISFTIYLYLCFTYPAKQSENPTDTEKSQQFVSKFREIMNSTVLLIGLMGVLGMMMQNSTVNNSLIFRVVDTLGVNPPPFQLIKMIILTINWFLWMLGFISIWKKSYTCFKISDNGQVPGERRTIKIFTITAISFTLVYVFIGYFVNLLNFYATRLSFLFMIIYCILFSTIVVKPKFDFKSHWKKFLFAPLVIIIIAISSMSINPYSAEKYLGELRSHLLFPMFIYGFFISNALDID